MEKERYTIQAFGHTGVILALAVGIWLPVIGHAWAADAARDKTMSAAADIRISYKVDPRVTRGLYMGNRWVSPPTYVGANGQDTVEVKAELVDATGRPVAAILDWVPSDAEMVTVSPAQGKEVKITVKRAGESRLQVASGGISKELSIKAVSQGDLLQVEIAAPNADPPAQVSAAQPAPPVPSEPDPPSFKNEKDKVSYALGVNVGGSLRKQSVDVDPDLLIQGFKESLSGGETLLTEAQVRDTLVALQKQLRSRQTALQTEKRKELAEKNKSDGEAFLAQNQANEGVVTLESGLQYKVLKAGDGSRPTPEDTVVCHYRGTFIYGTEFDSSYKRGKPATFVLSRVIKGWAEALQLMPAGSKWQLFIPADLAYGAIGSPGKIAPNAALVFEVELVSVQGKSGASEMAGKSGKDDAF